MVENHGNVPCLQKLMFMCLNSYKRHDFVKMEYTILSELRFYMINTTPEDFILVFTQLETKDFCRTRMNLARYLVQNAILHSRFIGVLPSVMARAAIELSKIILLQNEPCFYGESLVKTCMLHMMDILKNQNSVLIKKVTFY
jgi:hypothetical protein